MNWLDLAILGVIALSAGISLIRGFVREVLSVLVWVAAFWVAVRYSGAVALLLEEWIASPTIRLGAGFVVLFVGTLILGALLNNALSALVTRTGLGGTDRLLGVLFGAARGAVVVALVVLLLGFSPMTQERAWEESVVLPGIKPWICRAGLDAWLEDFDWQPPVEGEAMEGFDGLPDYWAEYCAGRRP
ncbi:MAG: CvpA family protein [Halorhodospira halophila]|uniref:CvpA family protein n=1 Tax=Halorhodospira TaxID=85108 RepID=UPI001911AF53|nr:MULTISPECIES: CvpA family protein [Halorhodospira]MBK5936258.1 colicin V production protein [Halorhodospira halophila]MBK5944117.1 colicin V production protein [Halorhodospira halophila]MCC3749849.1 CvpA family protein [Halorhodospira halophila]MCG5527769.1 CvpA family protein [Halorhodospira halophila]MCG5532761.1 CvpA family protein [Halorhodospira sp. 9621]